MNASYQPPPIPKALESCAEILYEQSRNRTGQDRDMICFQKIAERRIIEAINRGEFDNLPGAGQPLELVDDSHVPEDLRMAYKVLKNAGYVPPEISLRKEIVKTEQLLAGMEDTKVKYRQLKKLNFLITKLNMMRRIPTSLEKSQHYEEKLVERFGS
jgi:hypothetical protein